MYNSAGLHVAQTLRHLHASVRQSLDCAYPGREARCVCRLQLRNSSLPSSSRMGERLRHLGDRHIGKWGSDVKMTCDCAASDIGLSAHLAPAVRCGIAVLAYVVRERVCKRPSE